MTKITITQEQREAIEAGWIRRAIAQNTVPNKAPGVTYLRAELEYFVGALNACEVLGVQAGTLWTMKALIGRPIVDINKVKNAQIEARKGATA